MSDGWFLVKRGMLSHDLFRPEGPFSRLEAWLWLIEAAAFEDTTVAVDGATYPLSRGSVHHSERYMAAAWRWERPKVQRFLKKLVAEGAVEKVTVPHISGKPIHYSIRGAIHLRLCNYEKYQDPRSAPRSAHRSKVKEDLPLAKAKGASPPASAPAAQADIKKIAFDQGTELLTGAGVKLRQAKALLGRWIKDHGEAAVVEALGRAQREGAVDPQSYIAACLKRKERTSGPQIGDTRTLRDGRKQEFAGATEGWMDVD